MRKVAHASREMIRNHSRNAQPGIRRYQCSCWFWKGSGLCHWSRIQSSTRSQSLTQEVSQEPSPLQKELGRVTRIIAFIAVLLGITLFAVNLWVVKLPSQVAFIFAIGLTVANVPEGLLPTVTLALAASVQKMARKNALIKRLSSVETLGSTNIICTDKTGTITKNEMTVRKIWIPCEIIDVTGAGYSARWRILA